MHVQKTWESIMNAPIALDDIVLRRDAVGRAEERCSRSPPSWP
jgi:hypothetical protein